MNAIISDEGQYGELSVKSPPLFDVHALFSCFGIFVSNIDYDLRSMMAGIFFANFLISSDLFSSCSATSSLVLISVYVMKDGPTNISSEAMQLAQKRGREEKNKSYGRKKDKIKVGRPQTEQDMNFWVRLILKEFIGVFYRIG
jgi:hypothetical protein